MAVEWAKNQTLSAPDGTLSCTVSTSSELKRVKRSKEHVSVNHVNKEMQARVRMGWRGWADRDKQRTTNNVVHEKEREVFSLSYTAHPSQTRLRNDIEPVFNTHLKALDSERFKDVANVLNDTIRTGLTDLIGGGKNAEGKLTYHHLAAPVAAAILFGKQKSRGIAAGTASSCGSKCMQGIHQITRTTPVPVQTAAVPTLWTLSLDSTLQKCGQRTGVNWHLVGEHIHEWLLNELRHRERHEPVLHLFRKWDDELFPDTEASLGSALGTGSANTKELQAALDAWSQTKVVEMDEGSGGEEGSAGGETGANVDSDGSRNGEGEGENDDEGEGSS
ncbi:hypothetical protein B0H19DRAFT_1243828 [Mycena capillaripes]|nr:hypothetical protein B0H19DRAFT_1243828 [Mycena capillaripes]